MKKIVWVLIGGIAIIIVGILVGRPEKSGKPDGLERTQGTQEEGIRITNIEQGTPNSEGDGGTAPRKTGVGKGMNYTKVESVKSADKLPVALSDAVKALVGLDGKKHNYPSLLAAINELDQEMSAADMAALREILNFSNDRFPEKMRPIEINAVKNDVLDKLLRQKQLPDGLGLQMVEMAGNADNDPVWRDYCIQFFPTAWERIDAEYRISNREQGISKDGAGEGLTTKNTKHTKGESEESVKSVDELSAIHDAMFQALDERAETLAGTSLIGLELLSRTHDEFDRETIIGKASEIALDETASAASRLTALRLAAQISNIEQGTGNIEVQEAARNLAQTGETVLLRSAAIVTVGEVGTPDDRELLESYLLADNKQIADAAKMALAKMSRRN